VRGAHVRRRCRRRVLFAVAASVRRRGVRHQSLGGSRGQATSAWPTIPDRTSRVRSGRNAACSSQHAACSARFSNVEDAPRRGLAAGRGTGLDGTGRSTRSTALSRPRLGTARPSCCTPARSAARVPSPNSHGAEASKARHWRATPGTGTLRSARPCRGSGPIPTPTMAESHLGPFQSPT
jgi:hypothetical protein